MIRRNVASYKLAPIKPLMEAINELIHCFTNPKALNAARYWSPLEVIFNQTRVDVLFVYLNVTIVVGGQEEGAIIVALFNDIAAF